MLQKSQSDGHKKVLKKGTGRFAIERGFSKEWQIKPTRSAFTKKKYKIEELNYLTGFYLILPFTTEKNMFE